MHLSTLCSEKSPLFFFFFYCGVLDQTYDEAVAVLLRPGATA